jgi:hypothetical protein
MKKSVFWGAAAALAVIAPGAANAQMTGHAGASYGFLDSDSNSGDAISSWSGGFTAPLHGKWDFQFDGASMDMDHVGHTHPFGSVQGHAIARGESHAVGVFVSSLNVDGSNFYGLGVEGAMYFNNFTWSGQAGWATPTYDDPDETWNVGTQLTYFVNDQFTLGGEVGYTDTEYYGADVVTYGLNVEYQFSESPFSASLGWIHSDGEYDNGFEVEADVIAISGRINFGTSDLRDRDRNGASFLGLANVNRDHALLY